MSKQALIGVSRKRRRRQAGRRPEWVRPYRKAQRKLDSAVRLLVSSMDAASVSERSLERRPVLTAQRLNGGARHVAAAELRLLEAKQGLDAAAEWVAREPEQAAGDAALIVELAAERWQAVTNYLHYATNEVLLRQVEVLAGLVCGELVAEHPSDRRPRIVVAPRPVPVRAFLAVRRPRVVDRISAILQRRRRTPRPAALTVPPRTCQGRAPPLSSISSL
jgi:hypothetical protein